MNDTDRNRLLILDAVIDGMGIYPQSTIDKKGNKTKRTQWQEGWNACLMEMSRRKESAWQWFSDLTISQRGMLSELLEEDFMSLEFDDSKPICTQPDGENICNHQSEPDVKNRQTKYCTKPELVVPRDQELCHCDFLFRSSTGKTTCSIIVNDIFYWGCADREELPLPELPLAYRMWKDHGYSGLMAWASRRRGVEPQEQLVDEMYLKAKASLAELLMGVCTTPKKHPEAKCKCCQGTKERPLSSMCSTTLVTCPICKGSGIEPNTCLTCGRQTCDRQPEDDDPEDCEDWKPR